MLLGEGFLGFVLLAFWIWALIDTITSDPQAVRNLPKWAWIVLVILLSDIGAVLWLVAGRPPSRRWGPAGPDAWGSRRPTVVDDRPEVRPAITDRRSAELDRQLEEWEASRAANPALEAADRELDEREAELERRERELRRRELELRDRELDARERDLDA